jgi:acyl carrier protein
MAAPESLTNHDDSPSVVSRLNALFLDKLNIKVPAPDTDLIESRLLDSMQIVELLLQIEQEFGLRIELEHVDFDDLRSVARIAGLIGSSARPSSNSEVTHGNHSSL